MTRASLNGIDIDYQASGSGPAVLLSHGYSATRRMWDAQHAVLGEQHRVISWSMRGHGETESPADPASTQQTSRCATCTRCLATWVSSAR